MHVDIKKWWLQRREKCEHILSLSRRVRIYSMRVTVTLKKVHETPPQTVNSIHSGFKEVNVRYLFQDDEDPHSDIFHWMSQLESRLMQHSSITF